MSKRSLALFSLVFAGMFVFVACADPQQPTATPRSFDPTPAGGQPEPTATPSDATVAPEPTVPSGPDPEAGQVSFATNCAACHNVSDQTLIGPGLQGIGEKAAGRVPGQSAEDYLRISIKSPGEFVVEGFQPLMPAFPQLGEAEIENIVAYLITL